VLDAIRGTWVPIWLEVPMTPFRPISAG
jgi:hypothetical protein